MSPPISVVSIAHDHRTLQAHIQALDEQTLAYGDFDVVFTYDPRTTPVAARLVRLAAHRPNIRLVPDHHHLGPAALEATTAPIVVPVSTRTLLRPTALRDVIAAANGADIVIGGAPSISATWQLPGVDLLEPAALQDVPPVVAYRREILVSMLEHGPTEWPLPVTALQRAAAGHTIRVVHDPLVLDDADLPAESATLDVIDSAAEWAGGALSVSTALAHPGVDAVYVVATQADGSRVIAAALDDDGRYRAAIPVPGAGTWRLSWVAVIDDSVRWAPVSLEGLPPGIVDQRIVTRAPNTAAGLDVDRPRISLIALADATSARVVEDATGSLLTIPLGGAVTVFGTARIVGQLGLGAMPVPAHLIGDADGVRLEAYVSGLAGSVRLSERIGSGGAIGTGLELVIDDLGDMTVRPAKRSSPAGEGAPAHVDAPSSSTSAVQRLRRALPQPVVAVLDHVPGVRQVYGTFVRR